MQYLGAIICIGLILFFQNLGSFLTEILPIILIGVFMGFIKVFAETNLKATPKRVRVYTQSIDGTRLAQRKVKPISTTRDAERYPTINKDSSTKLTQTMLCKISKEIEINGALIIDRPWIDFIIDGKKVWEMRSTKFRKKGFIGLIEKGTKTIVGVAHIDGYSSKLSICELSINEGKHLVPKELYEAEGYKWNVAMYLSQTIKLKHPVPYKHKKGAVKWVKISDQPEVLKKLMGHLELML